MSRAIPVVLSIALTIFALADCVQSEDEEVRGIPRWAWIILIVLIPWVGPLTWLFVGKDRKWKERASEWSTAADPAGGTRRQAPGTSPHGYAGTSAPDDDLEFLRRLDADIRREKREREQQQGPDGDTSGDTGDRDTYGHVMPDSDADDSDLDDGDPSDSDLRGSDGAPSPEDYEDPGTRG
jgi:hypothetical protein